MDEINLASCNIEPRPYQQRIVAKVVAMLLGKYRNGTGELEEALRSVLIESPTGSGKTCCGLWVAKTLQEYIPDLVVGWVAMRRNLLVQSSAENQKLGMNVDNIHFVSMFEKEPKELLKARADGKKILLVSDEAQHDGAGSMASLYNKIRPDFILGLTATGFRADQIKLVFDSIVRDAGIHSLIQDGYLSEFDYYAVDNWSPEFLARLFMDHRERWGKSIFFQKSLSECHALAALLAARGVGVEVVTGSSDRDHQLARFRRGDVEVLINCMVLTEGFDDPTLQTVFVRPSSRGPTIQMAGRALRKHAAVPVKNIVQGVAAKHTFTKTAKARQQYLMKNGEWLSLKINPKLDLCSNNSRCLMAQTPILLPEFFTKKRRRRGARSQPQQSPGVIS